jgi:hypothetical protein
MSSDFRYAASHALVLVEDAQIVDRAPDWSSVPVHHLYHCPQPQNDSIAEGLYFFASSHKPLIAEDILMSQSAADIQLQNN